MSLISSTARRTLAAGAVVLVLGGSAVGIASAQSTPAPSATTQPARGPQAFIDALAKRLGISSSDLQTAIAGARTDVGAPAGGGFGPGGPGNHRGPGGPGGPGPGGQRGPGGFGVNLDAAAQAIGISADQLRQELPGKSLTDVATAHGKNPSDVSAALTAAIDARIDQEVTAGRLTADQATARKQQVGSRITQEMTQVVPQGGPAGRGGPGRGGPGGFGGNLDAAAQAIGISTDQLRQELPGKSLTDVATAHGKNPADVTAALTAAADTRIDQAVTAGRLTADQATTQKQQIATRIDQLMKQVMPAAPAAQ